MERFRKWLAAGTLLAAALLTVGADHLRPQQKSILALTTQPATQPTALRLFAGERPDEWESYQAMHAYMLDRFVRSDGFGLRRVVRMQDLARSKRIYADGTRYIVGRVELISLNDGKDPFAYVTMGFDVMKNKIKDAKHVPVDDSVLSALDELKTGKEVVLTGTGDGRELIGAVRAAAACTACHEVAEGALLGAFRYPLVKEKTNLQQWLRQLR